MIASPRLQQRFRLAFSLLLHRFHLKTVRTFAGFPLVSAPVPPELATNPFPALQEPIVQPPSPTAFNPWKHQEKSESSSHPRWLLPAIAGGSGIFGAALASIAMLLLFHQRASVIPTNSAGPVTSQPPVAQSAEPPTEYFEQQFEQAPSPQALAQLQALFQQSQDGRQPDPEEKDGVAVSSAPLKIQPESPTGHAFRAQETNRLREVWRLDQINDPKFVKLGEDLLAMSSGNAPRDMFALKEIQPIIADLNEFRQLSNYPFLVFGALPFTSHQVFNRSTNVIHYLEHHGADPRTLFELHAIRAGEWQNDEAVNLALRSLTSLLDTTKDFQRWSDVAILGTLFGEYTEKFFEREHAQISELIATREDLAPWIKDYVEGRHYYQCAWKARESGAELGVQRDSETRFREDMHEARIALEKSWNAHPEHPCAAAKMIQVCKYDNTGKSASFREMRLWFDRAIAVRADYSAAYAYYFSGIHPGNDGSRREMEAFGRVCLDTKRFDTIIPYFYLMSHQALAETEEQSRLSHWVGLPKEEVDRLDTYFAETEATSWRTAYRPYDRSMAAIIWCACGKYDRMMTWMQKLDFKLDRFALKELGIPEEEVLAHTKLCQSRMTKS